MLALGACTTGFPAQVSRFQAMPAPQGQSFIIQSADPMDRGSLEFSRYADLVRRHLIAQGYSEAPNGQGATLIVTLDYGVDEGRTEAVARPGAYSRFGYPYGYSAFSRDPFFRDPFYRSRFSRDPFYDPFYRPYYSRFGYYGRSRSPFYYGWEDPFWYSPYGYGYDDIRSYTVYTSFLDLDIKRAADGQSVFEGTAKARSRTDELQTLVPNLVEAMFQGFPGRSGETVRITVPPPPRSR